MDQRHYTIGTTREDERAEARTAAGDFIDLDRLLTIAGRRIWMVLACMVVATSIGIAYLIVAPREYTAQTSILLDNNLAKYASDQPSPAPAEAATDSDVSSEIEILLSQSLALSVVDKLHLDQNPDFFNVPISPFAWLEDSVKTLAAALLPQDAPKSARPEVDPARLKAAALLQKSVDVSRSGRSLVLNVTYVSNDPQMAKTIANAYADAYLSDQLDANFDATQRATVWLQARLDDLKQSAQNASMAAARYKAANGLTSARGELVSEQQLSDLNSQLILAQADLASASARYGQYKAIVDSGPKNAVENATISSKTSDNSVIADLKTRYLNVTNRADAVERQFGKDHPQAVSLRREQQDLASQIYSELQQLTNSYKNELDVAKSRVDSLQKNISHLTSQTSDANESLVHYRELQQRADALNTLYQSYLSRYEEASQQQSFPIAKARVISVAGVPTAPSSPSKKIVLALSMLMGLMFGSVAAAVLEFRERFFRVEDDVRSALGLKFLGYLPRLPDELAATPAPAAGTGGALLPPVLRVAAERPGSSYAETLRNAKLAVDVVLEGLPSKVIGVISALPKEGKSTVAANFASLLAVSGARTLLIDGDLRKPGLSRQLSEPVAEGLVEALGGETSWARMVQVDPATRLAILPALARGTFAHTSELLSSRAMAALVESAREMFDYVVVDLPPSAAVVDAKAFEPQVDGFVVVARWGETPRALLASLLKAEPRIQAKALGVILNQTDMKKLSRYAALGGSERYMQHYASYYTDPA